MRTLFHSILYLALGIWIGALVFFAMALAPVAFHSLPPLFGNSAQGVHAAGLMVGGSLVRLHWLGIVCGIVFLIAVLLGNRHFRTVIPQVVLVVVMLLLTLYSQFSILPRMDTARDSVGGMIGAVAPNNPARQIFDRLHREATHVEEAILLCGIAALVFTAGLAGTRYPKVAGQKPVDDPTVEDQA